MSVQSPDIKESSTFNLLTSIWIVPVVALIVAGWLAYQYYRDLGPEIKIIFPQSEGLQAGKSVIKYRDVVVGKITQIKIEKGGASVAVYARMDKSTKPFLNENTKFWIVKPEVGFEGVSGLDTLISGTYINVHVSEGEEFRDEFVGFPYIFRADKDGDYFHLNAPLGYNISQGTPIFFKNIKAGEVEYVSLSLDGQSIDFYVFIDRKYVPYIHTDSKFWVKSTLDLDFSKGRLELNVAPFSQLVSGGIGFSSTGEDESRKVPDAHIFHLYKSRSNAEGKTIGKGGAAMKKYEMQVTDSIADLSIDASVRYKGYDIGRVIDILTHYDPQSHDMVGDIRLQIDTSFFDSSNDQNITGEGYFLKAIEEGLYAKISTTDFITGALCVDLVFDENASSRAVKMGSKYPIIPSIGQQGGDILANLNVLVNNLNSVLGSTNKIVDDSAKPIHEILVNLNETMKNVNALMAQKELQNIPKELDKGLKHLTSTLEHANRVLKDYDGESLMNQQIRETLRLISESSAEMTEVLKMLNRKPNALIFGEE